MDKNYIGKYINWNVGIYLIENPLGAVYIGQSTELQRRIREIRNARCVSGNLRHSIFVHGRSNHKYYLLCALPHNCSNETLDHFEKLYIRQYRKDGYSVMNIADGGAGNKKRTLPSKDTTHWI